MTTRERILTVYRNAVPDRLPVGIYAAMLHTGSLQREAQAAGLGVIDTVPPSAYLAPPTLPLPEFFAEVPGCEFSISYVWADGQQFEWHAYDTPVGRVTQQLGREPAYGSRWRRKFYIAGPADYAVVLIIISFALTFLIIRGSERFVHYEA